MSQSTPRLIVQASEAKLQRYRDLQAQRVGLLRARWTTPGVMAADVDPDTRSTAALDLVDAELVNCLGPLVGVTAADPCDRLIVAMPPQEGKSQKVSRRTPAWLLARDPSLRIAIVSFEQERAVRWGRQIKRDIEGNPRLGSMITVQPDAHAAGRWHTTAGGGIYCVGIGGALTGEPVDVLIIDDPVKDRADAESRLKRDRVWDWWEAVGSTRLSPRGRVVLMLTRWHADDLAGRLEQQEPGRWRVVSIPAIAETDDPLGRQPGEELVSVRGRDPGYFHQLKATRSPYVFLGLFQQRPTAAEGNVFRRGDWRFWQGNGGRISLGDDGREHAVSDTWRFITMDLAGSLRTSADWTVAAVWAVTIDGQLVLLDRVRARVQETGHWDLVRPLRERWGVDVVHVESRLLGTSMVYEAGRAGVPIAELHADADKFTRALPAADRLKSHTVWLPAAAEWLDEWLDEHADFPNGRNDDQVDTFAYAVRVVSADYIAPGAATVPSTDALVGEMDLMNQPW